MTTITIQGYEFPVRPRYQAGHTLSETEAEALNQAYWDNLRNNFTSKVKAAKAQSGDVSEATLQDLIRQFEGYAQEYQFGQRRTAADPTNAQVEAQALTLARTALRDAMRQQGKKHYTAEQIEEAAHELVERDPSFRQKAERAVAERRANAEAALKALL